MDFASGVHGTESSSPGMQGFEKRAHGFTRAARYATHLLGAGNGPAPHQSLLGTAIATTQPATPQSPAWSAITTGDAIETLLIASKLRWVEES